MRVLQVVYAHLGLSAACVALLTLLKESPVYLVMVGKEAVSTRRLSLFIHKTSLNGKVDNRHGATFRESKRTR